MLQELHFQVQWVSSKLQVMNLHIWLMHHQENAFHKLILKKKFVYNFCIYLPVYGIWRFFIEYVRGDERGEFIPGLTPSQFWSIIMVLGTVPVYFLLKYLITNRHKSTKKVESNK